MIQGGTDLFLLDSTQPNRTPDKNRAKHDGAILRPDFTPHLHRRGRTPDRQVHPESPASVRGRETALKH